MASSKVGFKPQQQIVVNIVFGVLLIGLLVWNIGILIKMFTRETNVNKSLLIPSSGSSLSHRMKRSTEMGLDELERDVRRCRRWKKKCAMLEQQPASPVYKHLRVFQECNNGTGMAGETYKAGETVNYGDYLQLVDWDYDINYSHQGGRNGVVNISTPVISETGHYFIYAQVTWMGKENLSYNRQWAYDTKTASFTMVILPHPNSQSLVHDLAASFTTQMSLGAPMYDIQTTLVESDRYSKDSAYVSVVAKLTRGDILAVRMPDTGTKFKFDKDKTFFGFYLLSRD